MDDLMGLTKKILFAEYLLNRDDPEMFLPSAKQHILNASKEVLVMLTNLSPLEVESPQIASNVLSKFKDPTPKQFYAFYKRISKSDLTTEDATNALNKVKEFINWVGENKARK